MSTKAPHPQAGHTCHHPECCPSAVEAPVTATQGGEAGLHHHEDAVHTAVAALKRWLLWFLAFFGIYASSSLRPFCGTTGCPVGAGGAALAGGVFAALWQYGRSIWEYFCKINRQAQEVIRFWFPSSHLGTALACKALLCTNREASRGKLPRPGRAWRPGASPSRSLGTRRKQA